MRKLFIVGHPGPYGGASSELYHQIHLWRESFPEIELYIIPTQQGFTNEPYYNEMIQLGVRYERPLIFESITSDDAVINFCSGEFLSNLKTIASKTDRVAWANSMTWLFPKEKALADKNYIKFYLYQRPQIRDDHEAQLRKLGATGEFLHFMPYFNPDGWNFNVKTQHKTRIGRISRQDADKFAKNTLHIYEYIVSPKFKEAYFLGFDERSKNKIGKPMEWIKTFHNQNELPVKKFYDLIDFIVQPTDTTENWPRIGFEAMYSGKPLVVDNRGGWQYMIEHGISGFLCNNERDFIYWGSRLSYEHELREKIAENALARAKELSSLEVSTESWKKVFEKLFS